MSTIAALRCPAGDVVSIFGLCFTIKHGLRNQLNGYRSFINLKIRKIDGVTIPSPDTTIWRYVSYARFEQMIQESSIYLARLDQFSDFNEGTLTKAMQRRNQEEMEIQGAKDLDSIIPFIHQFFNHKYWYVSCWNSDKTQSNLLWRSYGTPKKDDKYQFKVAIKSSVAKLINSINVDNLYLGKVNYLDFEKDDPFIGSDGIESGSLVYTKQHEYKEENEIRLAFHDTASMCGGFLANLPKTEKGITVPVNLSLLLDEVYIEAFPVDWEKLGKNNTGTVDKEYKKGLCKKDDKQKSMIEVLFEKQQIQNVPIHRSSIL